MDTDGAVFPEALRRAIEESDAFLFVIAPASVESPYCEQQIEHARMLGKRILPVLRTKVPDDALHEEVRDRNWIPFEADDGFNGSIGLVRPRSPTTLPGRADGLEGLPQFLSGPSPLIPPADPHRAGRECARPISRDGN